MFQDDPVNGLLQSGVSKFCTKKKKSQLGLLTDRIHLFMLYPKPQVQTSLEDLKATLPQM